MSRLTPEDRARGIGLGHVDRAAIASAIRDALRERDKEWARAYRQTSGEAIRALMDDAEKGGGR